MEIFDPNIGKTGRHREVRHGDDVEFECPLCKRKIVALFVNTSNPMARCIKNHGKTYRIAETIRDGRSILIVEGVKGS